MEQFNTLLERIDLALSLGEEPTEEVLTKHSLHNVEYNELITLNSMIENDIELIKIYSSSSAQITKKELLIENYSNGYFPLLKQFGLVDYLPQI